MAAAILLPTLGLTSAAGAAPPPNVPSASTMRAQADRDSAAGFARIKAGKTASFDDCVAQAAKPKPKKGVVPCSRPLTPDEINPADRDAMLADIERDLGAPPPEPEPADDGSVTANAVAPGDGPPKTMICPVDGHRFEGRMKSCSIYNWMTRYVEFGPNGAWVIGESFQTAVEWDQLSSTNRSWTHHLTIRVHNHSWGDAVNGIWVWTTMRCSFPCQVSGESGGWKWVWVPKSQNQYGSGTLTANLSATGDYFDHNSNIYTKSPRTDPNLYATALTNSPDVIRCDKMSYVSTAVIGGCAYYRQPGYLKLRLSDTTTTESARFVFDTQRSLPGHPGVLGWPALTRATPDQQAANDAARRGPCDIARAAFALTDPTPEVRKDCDEYPFQSTAQGAASGLIKVHWDIKILNAAHNQKVGNMLSVLYATERFHYGDHFYVQFTL